MARYFEHMKFAYEYLDEKRLKFVANVNAARLLK